jgi:hypothetical protein
MAHPFIHVWLPGRGTLCGAYTYPRDMPHGHKFIVFFEVPRRHGEITCGCCRNLASPEVS